MINDYYSKISSSRPSNSSKNNENQEKEELTNLSDPDSDSEIDDEDIEKEYNLLIFQQFLE